MKMKNKLLAILGILLILLFGCYVNNKKILNFNSGTIQNTKTTSKYKEYVFFNVNIVNVSMDCFVPKYEKDLQVSAMSSTFTDTPYLHKQRVPLNKVKFDSAQDDLFNNECEGHCGV